MYQNHAQFRLQNGGLIMCGKKNTYIVILSVAVTLCVSLLICFILSFVYAKEQYGILSAITEQLVAEYPADEQRIVEIIKNSRHGDASNILMEYGFKTMDFIAPYAGVSVVTAVLFVIVFMLLLIVINHLIKSSYQKRIHELTQYLEQIDSGDDVEILFKKEDSFSLLQDEIYKTVTEMKAAKDKAVNERKEYADSLANIAHQIKTPVTAISLTAQTENNKGLKKQTDRLSRLVDSLLYISKIDAGVLNLKQDTVDVYTMLELSVETVEHIIHRKNITVKLPNHSEVHFIGDLDWSVEAFSNIIKNCAEHTLQNGTLELEYQANPLYTEITVKDDGHGFDKMDIKNIFKRFYQGKDSSNGIGIGLSIAKSIIEMQNGFITAENDKTGGARFNIRFYRH